jgi:hypothetical protein
MPVLDKIKDLTGKIDRKALAGAVGLMLLSWGALPIVYWLILRKKGDKNKKENDNNS